jgi:orotate phosphoribosyltransferase
MSLVESEVAKKLIDIKAIKVQPDAPFTWASGWKSPIYCDNRKILSYPETRTFVRDRFVDIIKSKYLQAEVIAGVATGAIAMGALVAEVLGLPFIYIRSAPKGHGLENLIEGVMHEGQKVVVVEDLISTGGSSLNAAEAVVKAGGNVLGMVAIFTYGFPHAIENFAKAGIELTTLSNYHALIDSAVSLNEVNASQVETLMKWRENPAEWGK